MKVAGLGVVSLRLQGIHLHTKSRIRDRGFVLLRHVQLALLLEPRASVPLTQDLELGPVCGELLRETPLRRDGARRSGLLVLGTGRRRGSNLSPLACLVEAVKLRKDEGARAGVLGARGRWWWWCACVGRGAAARAGRQCGQVRCRLLRAVKVLQKCCVQVLERIEGGGTPGGGIMEVVAWQPNLLSRASKSAQEGDKTSICRLRRGVPLRSVTKDMPCDTSKLHDTGGAGAARGRGSGSWRGDGAADDGHRGELLGLRALALPCWLAYALTLVRPLRG
jgi:hypothetical protein